MNMTMIAYPNTRAYLYLCYGIFQCIYTPESNNKTA